MSHVLISTLGVSSVHGDSPGVGCHALLKGIFPTQELNSGLPHCRQILYYLSHQGSPWIMEWVINPFSRGSCRSRDWTRVSCISGGVFTSWATREAPIVKIFTLNSFIRNVLLLYATHGNKYLGHSRIKSNMIFVLWTLQYSRRANIK